jgi:SlyX protein
MTQSSADPSSDPDDRVDKRLTEVEVKLTLVEDTVERLNEIVVRQQQQIDLLLREVGRLGREERSGDEPRVRDLRDETPPHY